jgi:hypothetical protein
MRYTHCEMYAREVHIVKIRAHQMHAHEIPAYEIHREMYIRDGSYPLHGTKATFIPSGGLASKL